MESLKHMMRKTDEKMRKTHEKLFRRAVEIFHRDRDQCEEYCRHVLHCAKLGDMSNAACHLMLANGNDKYLWHAEQAVHLYRNLYVVYPGGSFSGSPPPTPRQLEKQDSLISLAEQVLAKAKHDHDKIKAELQEQMTHFIETHGRRPADGELDQAAVQRDRVAIDIHLLRPDDEEAVSNEENTQEAATGTDNNIEKDDIENSGLLQDDDEWEFVGRPGEHDDQV